MEKENFMDKKLISLHATYGDWVTRAREGKLASARMRMDLYPYTELFSPIQVNGVTIRNRIVMGPMGNLDMCEETGRPSEKMIAYFIERARGGAGLITTGLIPVSHGIDPSVTEKGDRTLFPRIDGSRTVFSGWRDLAQGVHAYDSRIFVQITPGLGRVGPPTCVVEKKKPTVSASVNPNFYIPEIPCRPLTDGECRKIIKNCGQAAADAKEMGLDGVYLHGHEGYLLEQMTNPAFNRRHLGAFASYETFGLETVREIRKRVGETYPIMYRIDLSLALEETYGHRMDEVKSLRKFQGGRSIKDTLHYMAHLVEAGVDMFDVDLGCYDNWWLPHPPEGMPAGCFLPVAKIAKDFFERNHIVSNAGLKVPVVAVGKLGYPDLAEEALRAGDCDMVMLARPLLADPEWGKKAYAGRVSDIRPCIGCQEGCVNEFILGGHPQCAVNPRTGFEEVFEKEIAPAPVKKTVAVIGGGPAGMVFALVADRRGHDVTLYEKTDRLGGRIVAGSVPKIKFDFENYLTYLVCQIEKSGVHVVYETEIDEHTEIRADVCAVGCGTQDMFIPFEGLDAMRHVQAVEYLRNPEKYADATNVFIVGGGVVGCETALYMATEQKKQVTVAEMLPNFMEGVCTANRGYLLHYMEENGVKLLNAARVTGFQAGKVLVERQTSQGVPDPYNTWQPLLPENIPNPLAKKMTGETEKLEVAADLVVLSLGGRADRSLFEALKRRHVADEVCLIGDNVKPGRILEAVRSAYRRALTI